ncbi:uncharacterized protein LOC142768842 isoform X1 [Rhipicephalus microplus]|uniref:uncharacterized protein LOC142768842 isoform X1 n=1 Tax=Rhipicephalus microplus TaxID=6941 RepID=UPI003F6D2324
MWRESMHGSLIWKDCDLLGSFEGTKLPNGWLQAYFSSRAMQLAHMQSKSWSAPLVFCAGRSISIRQDTGINNNGCLPTWESRGIGALLENCRNFGKTWLIHGNWRQSVPPSQK